MRCPKRKCEEIRLCDLVLTIWTVDEDGYSLEQVDEESTSEANYWRCEECGYDSENFDLFKDENQDIPQGGKNENIRIN